MGGDRVPNELLQVPFLIRFLGGDCARRTEALVQFHDLLPMLLDLLGMANNTSSMQGQSFLPVLRGETDSHRELIITGYHEAPDRCIRDKEWSYVQRPEGEADELYNLVNDPRECNNLIDRYPEEAIRLAKAFGGYFRRGSVQPEAKGIQGKYELGSSSIL